MGDPPRRRAAAGEREQPTHRQPTSTALSRIAGEGSEQRIEIFEAVGRREGKPAIEHPAYERGNAGRELRFDTSAREHRGRQFGQRTRGERTTAVHALPQRHAEAELIRAGIDRHALELLGGHIRWRTHRRAGARQIGGERVGARPRPVARDLVDVLHPHEPEVHHEHATVVADHHVVGLEVAVHEPLAMRGRESASSLHHDGDHLAPRARTRLQPLPERHALHELHREKHLALVRADVMHGDDIGVAHPRHRLGLAQQSIVDAGAGGRLVLVAEEPMHEPPQHAGLAELGMQSVEQFERDPAVELGIVRRIDRAHAARAEPIEHHVATDRLAAREALAAWARTGVVGRRRTSGRLGLAAHMLPPASRCPLAVVGRSATCAGRRSLERTRVVRGRGTNPTAPSLPAAHRTDRLAPSCRAWTRRAATRPASRTIAGARESRRCAR